MIDDSSALKEVWEWKERAFQELKDCSTIEEKLMKRMELINRNSELPEPLHISEK